MIRMTRASTIALALVVALTACQDISGPASRVDDAPEAGLHISPLDALHAAAKEQIPIRTVGGFTIGIPAATLRQEEAEVLYYNDRIVERYRFLLSADGWSRGTLLDRAPFEPLTGAAGNHTWTASADGGDGVSMSFTWEESSNGTSGWTQVDVGSSYTRYVGVADSEQDFYLRVTATSNGKSAQSAAYYVDVDVIRELLAVSISGTDHVETSGYYTWNASVSGGLSPYTYQWQYCEGASCSNVSSSSSYGRYVDLGDRAFFLKLTVTDSETGQTQQQEYDTHNVYVSTGGGPLMPGGGQ